jgi:hypothetical protein
MRRNSLGGLSIKSALALGFGLTLVLWLFTGYQFAMSTATAERESAATAARYVEAQELLASLRTSVLATSGIARDALLDRTHQPVTASREQLRDRLATLNDLLARYTSVLATPEESTRINRLRDEATRFAHGLVEALEDVSDQSGDGRERFRIDVLPLRSSVPLRISRPPTDRNSCSTNGRWPIRTAQPSGRRSASSDWRCCAVSVSPCWRRSMPEVSKST